MHIYFAHPCFNESQETFKREFLGKLRTALGQSEYGKAVGIVDPFEDTPNIEGNKETKLKLSRTVKETCLRMLEDCDIIVALVDDCDTGVAFEAGYAHAINVPIILISKGNCDEANAMLIGAARERIDNILQEEQIGKLARMFEWYYISKERYSHEPGKN
jgi:nucleoside 2-deoxyribosyltransferase